jgi:hypothetical protein
MQSPDSFIVTPKKKKYKSGKKFGNVEFETVTSIENAKDVSKEAIIVALPLNYHGEIEVGDEVIVHHNIFRDYYNQRGIMKHSRAYLYDDLYTAIPEELFLYKKDGKWKANLNFCFVEPIEEDSISILEGGTLPHTGTIWLSNTHKVNEPIGFTPESEYEVWIDDKLYYRMRDIDVCIYDRFEV